MRTYRSLFERVVSFENLHAAYRQARRGKRGRPGAAAFELRCEDELLGIRRELLDGTYRFGGYREFLIHDPKERLVAAAPFRDRVVHHALVRVLEPIYESRFVHDSYACRKRRGTHRAVRRCQRFMRRHPYVLKADIWKFYPTVDHEVLLGILERRVRDANVLRLVRDILATWTSGPEYYHRFTDDDLFSSARPRGIPIGNLTSQFLANVCLDRIDQLAKRELGVRAYVRYMDDMLLFADSRDALRRWRPALGTALEGLRLRLHPQKCHVLRSRDGVPFLGFRVLPGRRLVLRQNVRRFVRRTRRQIRQVESGSLDRDSLRRSVRGWVAHASFADGQPLLRSLSPRLVVRGRGGRTEAVVPGAARRLVEQRNEQPPLRPAQQRQPEQPQQQHRVPLREDVASPGPDPSRRIGESAETSTVRSRPCGAEASSAGRLVVGGEPKPGGPRDLLGAACRRAGHVQVDLR